MNVNIMNVINKIRVDDIDYDIEDANALHNETDPTVPSHVKQISQQDINSWNNKSDFSGNYNDLSNKPDLSGFITNSVNDLLNYYKKSETYTQSEVNALINAITTIDLQVVQVLPTEDISTTTIYLVPKSTSETNNAYDEYVYVSNAWEKIGDTQVDLTGYVTTTDYATSSVGGVIKVSNGDYGLVVDEGVLKGSVKTKAQYEDASSKSLVAKGTLNNILEDYSTQDYVDTAIASAITDALGGNY